MATILVAVFCEGEFEGIKIREGQSREWGYGFCAGMEAGARMHDGSVAAYVVPDEEAHMRREDGERAEAVDKALREAADIMAKLGAHNIDTNDGGLSVLGCDHESPQRQAVKADTTEHDLIARLSLAIRKAWAAPSVGTSSEQAAYAVISELTAIGADALGGPLSSSAEMLATASDYAARAAAELWEKEARAILSGRNINGKFYDAFQAGARWAYNHTTPVHAAMNAAKRIAELEKRLANVVTAEMPVTNKAVIAAPNLVRQLALVAQRAEHECHSWDSLTLIEAGIRAVLSELSAMGGEALIENAINDYHEARLGGASAEERHRRGIQAACARILPVFAAKNASDERWAVACQCDNATMQLFIYDSKDLARIAFDVLNAQWSQTYLVTIVAGPGDNTAAWKPPMLDISMELLQQRDEAIANVTRMKVELEAMRARIDELEARAVVAGYAARDGALT